MGAGWCWFSGGKQENDHHPLRGNSKCWSVLAFAEFWWCCCWLIAIVTSSPARLVQKKIGITAAAFAVAVN